MLHRIIGKIVNSLNRLEKLLALSKPNKIKKLTFKLAHIYKGNRNKDARHFYILFKNLMFLKQFQKLIDIDNSLD